MSHVEAICKSLPSHRNLMHLVVLKLKLKMLCLQGTNKRGTLAALQLLIRSILILAKGGSLIKYVFIAERVHFKREYRQLRKQDSPQLHLGDKHSP